MLTAIEQLKHLEMAVQRSGTTPPEIVLPESRDIILRRMRFHYLDWGNEGATPIVFLHGGALNAHTWDVCCLDFRSQFHCVALDQRGHGDSEWSPEMDYRTESYVSDIEAFVEQLGFSRYVLIGMSMGGHNALKYASQNSHKLLGLVIVDVGPDLRIEGAKEITDFTKNTNDALTLDEFVDRAMAFNPRRDPALLRRSLLHNLRQHPDGRWAWKYDQRHRVKWDLDAMKVEHARLWDDVPNINCPTLVVRGGQSNVFFDEDAEKLASTLPNGRWVVVPDAGHTVQGDNPRGLIAELRTFFADVGIS